MRKDIDFDQFRNILEAERTTTQQHLAQEMKSFQAPSDPNPDFLDAASITIDQEERMGRLSILRGRLNMVEEALQRLEMGQFGICLYCGEDIGIDRLRAKPYAKYCIKCKEKKEKWSR
jgi:DnaK suppressor protein